MFIDVLGGGKISRLYQKLVYEKQIAQSVSCNNQSLMVTSMAQCDITARPGVKLEDLEAAFDKELSAAHFWADAGGAGSARNQMLSRLIQGLQRLGGFGGVADMMDRYNQYLHDPAICRRMWPAMRR
jgi:zinc protease